MSNGKLSNEAETPALNKGAVRRSFWCTIGFHKLRYIKQYCQTANIECERCGKRWIEGHTGLLFRQW